MNLFFAPEIEQTLTLPEDESRHAVKVMRMAEGEELWLTDGLGHRYRCLLRGADPRSALVEIVEKIALPPFWNGPITLAVAPTKHLDRMEWLVEKLTEEGVDRIVPLLCRWSERKDLKIERLRKIAVAAMKQSLKSTIPEILPMTPFSAFLKLTAGVPQRFIAHCETGSERELLSRSYEPHSGGAVVAIGPEGDFAPEEISAALGGGFRPVSLGEARLRTETAALTSLVTLHVKSQLAPVAIPC